MKNSRKRIFFGQHDDIFQINHRYLGLKIYPASKQKLFEDWDNVRSNRKTMLCQCTLYVMDKKRQHCPKYWYNVARDIVPILYQYCTYDNAIMLYCTNVSTTLPKI